jgi:hypothetical protein
MPAAAPASSACAASRLTKYHQLREALEAICELNHALLRPGDAAPRRARQTGD